MLIRDKVYGDTTINSEVILELLHSKALKRLKGISQFGIPDEFYYLKNFTRYDHSVGVMLLLRKLGASEEEQIAGLLHDVSHTAFSHIIDWVVGDGKTEDYQDEQHVRYVAASDIPAILKTHGYDVARIVDYHHFGLLERDLPDLCADRVDYSLREFPNGVAKTCVAVLTTKDNKIVFSDKKAALLFAQNFLKRQMEHWGGFEAVARYRLFADALRQALHDGTISEPDFWQDDSYVIHKLVTSDNQQVQTLLQTLRSKSLSHLPKSSTTMHKKFRHVDPLFLDKGKLARLSRASSEFAEELQRARMANEQGVVIPAVG